MDYKGNYFPDDEEMQESTVMPPSKASKVIKKVFKIALYSVAAFVYVILFWRIFSGCDPEMYTTAYFSDKTASAGKVTIYQVQPNEYMSYSGRVQLDGNAYAAETNELEFGVKVNLKGTEHGDQNRLVYVLRDSHGTEYEISAFRAELKDSYYYARVCFGGVELDLDANYYIQKQRMYESGEALEDSVDNWPEGLIYRLFVYEKADDGTLVLIDDLTDKEYLAGKHEIDESGLKVYNDRTVVKYD